MKNIFVLIAMLLWFGTYLLTNAQQDENAVERSRVSRLNHRKSRARGSASIHNRTDKQTNTRRNNRSRPRPEKPRVVKVAMSTQVNNSCTTK